MLDSSFGWRVKYLYQYDKNNNLIKKVREHFDEPIRTELEKIYDDNNNIIEEIIYNQINEPDTKYEYIYSK